MSWQLADGVTESTDSEYIAALYWSITTMTTVGFGDVTPQSDSERVFCIFSMVLTGGFYGQCFFFDNGVYILSKLQILFRFTHSLSLTIVVDD